MPRLTIDGQMVEVAEGATILDAARKLNIKIPTLCYHPDQNVKANCRICVVEVEGQRLLQPSCSFLLQMVWLSVLIQLKCAGHGIISLN